MIESIKTTRIILAAVAFLKKQDCVGSSQVKADTLNLQSVLQLIKSSPLVPWQILSWLHPLLVSSITTVVTTEEEPPPPPPALPDDGAAETVKD